jgi:hypothetical protein
MFLPQTETPATLDVDMQAVDDVPAVGDGDVPVIDEGLPVMTTDSAGKGALQNGADADDLPEIPES